MEKLGSFAALTFIGEDHVAASVDYHVCHSCGFRLMRVETTMINDQRIVATQCPICEQPNSPTGTNVTLSEEKRQQKFDVWLVSHGLDREILEQHYHLSVDHFFDEIG